MSIIMLFLIIFMSLASAILPNLQAEQPIIVNGTGGSDGSGGNVTSVSSGDNFLIANPTTGDIVISANSSQFNNTYLRYMGGWLFNVDAGSRTLSNLSTTTLIDSAGIRGAGVNSFTQFNRYLSQDLVSALNWEPSSLSWNFINSLIIGDGTAGTDYNLTFDGEKSDGSIIWKEDEDSFEINDRIYVNNLTNISFGGGVTGSKTDTFSNGQNWSIRQRPIVGTGDIGINFEETILADLGDFIFTIPSIRPVSPSGAFMAFIGGIYAKGATPQEFGEIVIARGNYNGITLTDAVNLRVQNNVTEFISTFGNISIDSTDKIILKDSTTIEKNLNILGNISGGLNYQRNFEFSANRNPSSVPIGTCSGFRGNVALSSNHQKTSATNVVNPVATPNMTEQMIITDIGFSVSILSFGFNASGNVSHGQLNYTLNIDGTRVFLDQQNFSVGGETRTNSYKVYLPVSNKTTFYPNIEYGIVSDGGGLLPNQDFCFNEAYSYNSAVAVQS